MATETANWSDVEGRLAGRIDQLLGWAKAGQRPEYPAQPNYYILKAENADRLRDDILAVIRELGGLAGDMADHTKMSELERGR